jgi:hypothetical protein
LREEHELIASFMKRNQEKASEPEGLGSATMQVASLASLPLSLVDPPLPEPRPAAQKAAARIAPNPSPGKSPRRVRRRRLSRPPLWSYRRPSSYWHPRRRRLLELSSSRSHVGSSAPPAKCASGSRTSLRQQGAPFSCPVYQIAPRRRPSPGRSASSGRTEAQGPLTASFHAFTNICAARRTSCTLAPGL